MQLLSYLFNLLFILYRITIVSSLSKVAVWISPWHPIINLLVTSVLILSMSKGVVVTVSVTQGMRVDEDDNKGVAGSSADDDFSELDCWSCCKSWISCSFSSSCCSFLASYTTSVKIKKDDTRFINMHTLLHCLCYIPLFVDPWAVV